MIQRFSHLPLTRRQFGRLALGTGVAVGAEYVAKRKAYATGTPFTIAMVPDPQYLTGGYNGGSVSTCSGATVYNALIQWAITNRNLSVAGTPLNIKGFIQVGDCCNETSSTSFDLEQQRSVNAYALAEAASPKMFVTRCAGNHDYDGKGAITNGRNGLAYMFRNDKAGAWSPTNLATIYSGGMDLGSGDVAVFGGAYADPTAPISTANAYYMLNIQGMRIGVLALEYYPRSAVMNWAQTVQAAHPTYQWWVTTHGYQDTSGARIARGSIYGPGTGGGEFGDAPNSNSGIDMWDGSDVSWGGLKLWPNLTGVFCGHWIDGYTSASASNWVYQRLASTSASARGQTVQQTFCNCQGSSGSGDQQDYCSSNPATPNGTSDTMHLLLMRFTPSTEMMEHYLVSTNSGKWTGGPTGTAALSGNNASPILLSNVSMPNSPATTLFPLPMSATH